MPSLFREFKNLCLSSPNILSYSQNCIIYSQISEAAKANVCLVKHCVEVFQNKDKQNYLTTSWFYIYNGHADSSLRLIQTEKAIKLKQHSLFTSIYSNYNVNGLFDYRFDLLEASKYVEIMAFRAVSVL